MSDQSGFVDIIELIYGAAADPEQWQPALDAIGAHYPGGCTSLIVHDLAVKSGNCAMFSGWDPAAIEAYNAYFGARNPRFANLNKWPAGLVAPAERVFDRAELFKTEFYNDFLKPNDLPDGLGVTLVQDQTRFVRLSVLYPDQTARNQDRNVALMQRLTPHLQRAMQLNRHVFMANMRWHAAEESLNRIVLGVFVVDGSGKSVFSNRAAERILKDKDGLSLSADGRLKAAAREDHARLVDAIRVAGQARYGAAASGIVRVRRPSLCAPYAVLAIPLGIQAKRFSASPGLVTLFVSDPLVRSQPPVSLIAQSYDLTRAEARVLDVLLAGHGLMGAAETLKISPHTAKTHLRSIFEKVGCSRQAELVQAVARHPAWMAREEP